MFHLKANKIRGDDDHSYQVRVLEDTKLIKTKHFPICSEQWRRKNSFVVT
jgi:hypothetical protein